MLLLFLKSLIIGFVIAAPVGPVGILCIQRSLHNGFKIGLATGIGAALANGVYSLIAGFGLTAISSLLLTHEYWIRLFGGIFLLYLGIKILFVRSSHRTTDKNTEHSAGHACLSSLFLTLVNPITIISFIAIFATPTFANINTNYTQAALLVIGITLGSALWWLLLSSGVAFILHHRVNSKIMRIINWLSGLIMLAFGLYALYQ